MSEPMPPSDPMPQQTLQPWMCGARCRGERAGRLCEQPKVGSANRCRLHGGLSTGPRLKTGRYSAVLVRLRDGYEEALNSKSLLDLKEPVALLDAVVRQLAARAELDGDSPDFRKRALEAYREARESENFDALGELLKNGVDEDRATSRLTKELDRLARRIEGAWSVKLQRKNALSIADLKLVVLRIMDIVQKHVAADTFRAVVLEVESELTPRTELSASTVSETAP